MKTRLITLATTILAFPVQANAQVPLGDALKLNQTDSLKSTFPTLNSLVNTILPNLYIISGIILFFYAIFGGITMIGSGENPEALEKGKQAITGAIIGFAIIFTSYWLIQIIEIITGIEILNSSYLIFQP